MTAIAETMKYISELSQMVGGVPAVVLWLVGALFALLLSAIFFKRLRQVLFILMQASLVVLLLCGTLVGVFLLFFDRGDSLANYDDGRNVRLLGICRDVQVSPRGEGRRASFVLRTPTGRTRVVTTSGAPAEGAVIYIRGRKGTFKVNRTFVESEYQLSAF